jgi:hypothetical protein
MIHNNDFPSCMQQCFDSLGHCCIFSDKDCDELANDILGRDTTLPDGRNGDLDCAVFYEESTRTLISNALGNSTIFGDLCT